MIDKVGAFTLLTAKESFPRAVANSSRGGSWASRFEITNILVPDTGRSLVSSRRGYRNHAAILYQAPKPADIITRPVLREDSSFVLMPIPKPTNGKRKRRFSGSGNRIFTP